MNKTLIVYSILAVITISSLSANGMNDGSHPAASTDKSNSLIDSVGRTIQIEKPFRRIVYNHLSIGEALRIVGAWDLVVGRDSYIANQGFFPGQEELPQISGATPYEIHYETIYGLDVDLCIIADLPMAGLDEIIEMLEPEITVVVLNFYEPATMSENINKLGLLLGREAEAEEFSTWYMGTMRTISDATSLLEEDQKPFVFHKHSRGGPDYIDTFTNTFPGQTLGNAVTGSINVGGTFDAKMGYALSVDPEWLIEKEMDFILIWDFLADAYGSEKTETKKIADYRNIVMEHPVFSKSRAVRKGNVYMVSKDFLLSPLNNIDIHRKDDMHESR